MQVSEKLESVGLRAAAQRLAVLRVFEANEQRCWNTADVYRQATADRQTSGAPPSIARWPSSRTSASRLQRARRRVGGGVLQAARFAAARPVSVCLGCEQVHDFVDDALEARTRRVAESHEFVLRRYQLILYGYCSRCRASSGVSSIAVPGG